MPDDLRITIRAEDLASRNIQGIADALKKAGVTAEEVRPALEAFGISVDQVASAMGRLGGAAPPALDPIPPKVQNAAQSFRGMNNSMLSSLSTLRSLRVVAYSTLGLLAVGFYISEWERLADGIKNAALALGGFDDYMKQVQADAVAASDAAMTVPADLSNRILQAVKSAHTLQDATKARTEIELQAARQAEQNWTARKLQLDAEHELRGQISDAERAASAEAVTGFAVKSANMDALIEKEQKSVFNQLSAKDLTDKRKEAEKELNAAQQKVYQYEILIAEQSKRGATAVDKLSSAEQRAAEAIATATVRLPPYIEQLERESKVLDTILTGHRNSLQIMEAQQKLAEKGLEIRPKAPAGIPPGLIGLPIGGAGLPAPAAGLPIDFASQRKVALTNLATEEESNWRIHGDKMVSIETQQENQRFAIEVRYAKETLRQGAQLDARMEELEAQHQQKLKKIEEKGAKERAKLHQEMMKEITRSINVALDGWIQGTQRFSQAFEHAWNSLAITAIENIASIAVAEATGTATATQQLKIDALKHAAHAAAVTFDKAITSLPFPANIIVAPIEAAAILAKGLALASFDQGGIVPQTGIAMVHGGEMVLPQNISHYVQNAALSGQGSSSYSNTFNLYHHGDDARKVMDREMVPRIQKALRRGQIR